MRNPISPGKHSFGTLLLVLLLLVAKASAVSGGQAHGQGSPEGSAVTLVELESEGLLQVKPDKASFTFGVVTEAPLVAEASQANARDSEKFLHAVKKLLGPNETVKTVSFHVEPIFRKVEQPQGKGKSKRDEVVGYRASHRFVVELLDMTKLGQVADTGLKNGATEIMGPFFSHTQEEELRNQAVVKALERSRALAEALAKAAGLKIRRIVKMSTAHPVVPRQMAVAKALPPGAAAPEVETPIEIGDITFSARLLVTFELGP